MKPAEYRHFFVSMLDITPRFRLKRYLPRFSETLAETLMPKSPKKPASL